MPLDEAEHATRVLRIGVGAGVRVFDGIGREFLATVSGVGRAGVTVMVDGACPPPSPEAAVAITLCQAVLKGDKMDAVVRDAVMMGVTALQPLVSARAETSLAALERGHRRERWQRVAVASAKQCGRAVVPPVHVPCAVEALTALTAGRECLICAEPSVVDASDATAIHTILPPSGEVVLVVGPEGGWAPEDVAAWPAHAHRIRVGARTLRADVAALVTLSALLSHWKQL